MDQISSRAVSLKSRIRGKTLQIISQIRLYFLNWHFLLCFGIAWLITNGWSYIALGIGTFLGWPWLIAVSSAYLALLWIPFTPEKLITVMIAMLLLRWIFPKDRNALELLENLKKAAVRKHSERKTVNSDRGAEREEE
ncbi:MAG: hypothetical protein IKD62_07760 [Oscillospiraceae bacterium]|nr:hypothetical protein [Oscillospiraceae bacterium]